MLFFPPFDSFAGRLFAHVQEPAGGLVVRKGGGRSRTRTKESAAWEERVLYALFWGWGQTTISLEMTELSLGTAFV